MKNIRNKITLDIDSLIESVGIIFMLKYVRLLCFTPKIYQKDFAKELHVSLDSVKSWECGRRKPSKRILNQIKEMVE